MMKTLPTGLKALLAASVLVAASGASAQPEPRDKSRSPQTDLSRYPKLESADFAQPKPVPRKVDGKGGGEVVVENVLPNGTTEIIRYSPGPGMTAEELLMQVRASGETNAKLVHDHDQSASVMGAWDCSYGIARSFCPQRWWSRNGVYRPQVMFSDHSSYLWPVDQAVYAWNRASRIDSLYNWNSCAGISHCVNVYSVDAGRTWRGRTYMSTYTGTNQIVDGSVHVWLNEYYTHSSSGYRWVVCHELGHALGLDHAVNNQSCMFDLSQGATVPHSNDYSMLFNIYVNR